jgi:SSS family solute:Na+ symporter
MLGAALKLLPLFIMVLPGALAVSLFPGLARGDEVYPTLVRELLPAGLRGLAIAGLIAEAIGRTAAEESVSSLFD